MISFSFGCFLSAPLLFSRPLPTFLGNFLPSSPPRQQFLQLLLGSCSAVTCHRRRHSLQLLSSSLHLWFVASFVHHSCFLPSLHSSSLPLCVLKVSASSALGVFTVTELHHHSVDQPLCTIVVCSLPIVTAASRRRSRHSLPLLPSCSLLSFIVSSGCTPPHLLQLSLCSRRRLISVLQPARRRYPSTPPAMLPSLPPSRSRPAQLTQQLPHYLSVCCC